MTFKGVYLADVKVVLFLGLCVDTLLGRVFYGCFFGRCRDDLDLVPREMSRWFGFRSSGDTWLCVDILLGSAFQRCLLGRRQDGLGFGSSGDVKMVWFWFLGRCQDGLVSGNSGDVEVA